MVNKNTPNVYKNTPTLYFFSNFKQGDTKTKEHL